MSICVCARELLSYNLLDPGRQSPSQINGSWQSKGSSRGRGMCDTFFSVYVKVLCMTNHVPGNRME